MSADLYLRVVQPEHIEGVTSYLAYDSLDALDALRTAHPDWDVDQIWDAEAEEHDRLYRYAYDNLWSHPRSDALWVGAVSWLKAGLLSEVERYVPGPVYGMQRLWGEPVEATPLLVKCSMDAMNLPNRSIYGRVELLYSKEAVEANWGWGSGRRRYRHRSDDWGGPRRTRFPNGQRMVSYKTRGTQRARVVKRWLERHEGEFVVATSD